MQEVATIQETWSEASIERYRNDKRSINIVVSNTDTQDILFIADYVKNYVSDLNKTNNNIDAKILSDASNPLKQRIELLSKNGKLCRLAFPLP